MRVVLERPRWARRDLALKLTGVAESRLLKLVKEGFVRARKMETTTKSGCVFCVTNIEEWLENEAPMPARSLYVMATREMKKRTSDVEGCNEFS